MTMNHQSKPAISSTHVRLSDIVEKLEGHAPLTLAESWDNVGLLAGDLDLPVHRIMTCLTISRETVREAIESGVQLVVAHHPLPFKPLQRIVTSTAVGQSLWPLIREGIAIYSPHTAWDSASNGINARLAAWLNLIDVRPIRTIEIENQESRVGVGRIGRLEPTKSIGEIVNSLRNRLPSLTAFANQQVDRQIAHVAIVCGSGGSFVDAARQRGADLLLTGEATYHQCLEAQSMNLGLLLIGHFASERFSMDALAGLLQTDFPTLDVWASRNECDPMLAIV